MGQNMSRLGGGDDEARCCWEALGPAAVVSTRPTDAAEAPPPAAHPATPPSPAADIISPAGGSVLEAASSTALTDTALYTHKYKHV